jgi:hypothetical protein
MKRSVVPLLLLLAACTTGDPLTDVTRQVARSVVTPVVQQFFPGPESAAVTDCILNNATQDELLSLARDVAVEAGTSTVQTVLTIAKRPATVQCIAASGAIPLL